MPQSTVEGDLQINGQGHYLGYFATKRERADARAAKRRQLAAEVERVAKPEAERLTVAEYIADVQARMEDGRLLTKGHRYKASSIGEIANQLASFERKFGNRVLASFTRAEAVREGRVNKAVVALFNRAVDEELLERNPFRGLGKRSEGRSDEAPPTIKELARLRDGCDALGDYAPRMRDLMDFAAYTLMRPGELYELRHPDADLVTNRIEVSRRLYRGVVDVPKSGKPKTIALVPPARDILLRQPTRTRDDGLVFVAKQGKRLTAPTLCQYWKLVCAHAHLDFDFYLATKHLGVHRLYKLGLSKRAIAAQAGWSEEAVDDMLRIYGHTDLVALAEVDALYGAGATDAQPMHEGRNAAL